MNENENYENKLDEEDDFSEESFDDDSDFGDLDDDGIVRSATDRTRHDEDVIRDAKAESRKEVGKYLTRRNILLVVVAFIVFILAILLLRGCISSRKSAKTSQSYTASDRENILWGNEDIDWDNILGYDADGNPIYASKGLVPGVIGYDAFGNPITDLSKYKVIGEKNGKPVYDYKVPRDMYDGWKALGIDGTDPVKALEALKGLMGTNGKNGFNGIDGLITANNKTLAGISGRNGANGANGSVAYGKNGGNGYDGKNGVMGQHGLAGYNGFDGKTVHGLNGINGYTGANGANGSKGIVGKNGKDGSGGRGLPGTNGFDGRTVHSLNGINGKAGAEGANGSKGDPGSGTNGKNGKDGNTSNTTTTINKKLDGTNGQNGANGARGDNGSSSSGKDGDTGLDAYQLAVKNGFQGSYTDWLKSLKGEKGDKGDGGTITATDGRDGQNGQDGNDGNGKKGNDGKDGNNGENGTSALSPYEEAKLHGFTGTYEQWVNEYLKGKDGKQGASGKDGSSGKDGNNGKDGNDGNEGKKGTAGSTGKSGTSGQDASTYTMTFVKYSLSPDGGASSISSTNDFNLYRKESTSTDTKNIVVQEFNNSGSKSFNFKNGVYHGTMLDSEPEPTAGQAVRQYYTGVMTIRVHNDVIEIGQSISPGFVYTSDRSDSTYKDSFGLHKFEAPDYVGDYYMQIEDYKKDPRNYTWVPANEVDVVEGDDDNGGKVVIWK